MSDAAKIGELTLLVYRECPCGRWCATPEGAHAPMCGACGGYYVPAGTAEEKGLPMYGRTLSEQRRMRGLAFVGLLTLEMGAVTMLSRARHWLGLVTDDAHYLDRPAPKGRLLYPLEAKAASDVIAEDARTRL